MAYISGHCLKSKNKKFLPISKPKALLAYLTDPSNELDIYLRNRIRKYVIPALRQTDNRFDHNFLRTLSSIQSAEQYLTKVTQKKFSSVAHQAGTMWHLNTLKLQALDSFMQPRVILEWLIKNNVPFIPTEAFLKEILRFIMQPGSKSHVIHERWSIIKKKNIVYINTQ